MLKMWAVPSITDQIENIAELWKSQFFVEQVLWQQSPFGLVLPGGLFQDQDKVKGSQRPFFIDCTMWWVNWK